MSLERPILWLLLVVGVIASLYVAMRRDRVEQANTSVDVGIEYAEVRQVALLASIDVEQALRRLRDAGAPSLILSEDTLTSLRQSGAASFIRVLRQFGAAPQFELRFPDTAVAERVRRNVAGRLRVSLPWAPRTPAKWMPVPAALTDVPELGVGLDEQALARAADAEMRIAARPAPAAVATGKGIEFVANEMRRAGASVVIFTGNAVLGHPGQSKTTAEALRKARLLYGSVEFGKQLGDQSLSRALDGEVLRVHAITAAEMATMSPAVGVERFVRAVRERDVRFCYVRLFLDSRPDVLEANVKYLRTIAERLRSSGFTLGPAQPLQDFVSPQWALIAACVGVVGGVVLLIASIGRLSFIGWAGLALLGIAAAVAGLWMAPALSRKLFALLAALTFPVLAVVRLHHVHSRRRRSYGALLGGALGAYLSCAAVSLCGACLIVGLLSDRLFMVKVDQFTGVKLSLHLPLLAVGVIYLGAMFASKPSWREQCRLAVRNWRTALATAVPYGHVLIVLAILAGAAVILLRSGNEPGFGLSQAELSFRSMLERILVVRPRQKEFLVGHPLLLLGIALMLCGTRRGTWVLLACATIGQTSMVNTFCHIHTPLRISVLRTVNGLWVGAVLGIILITIYWLARRPLQHQSQENPSATPGHAGSGHGSRRRAPTEGARATRRTRPSPREGDG